MTTRKDRPAFAVCFVMLVAAAVLLISFAQPVWAANDEDYDPTGKKEMMKEISESGEQAEQEEGQGLHADPTTFQKNFDLTVEQKEETITTLNQVVSMYTEPKMSDLQKYYELAKWANQRVVYDGEFWDGKYNMEYYSHQWDAYGAVNEDEKSVCAGIAIFYSNLCHAADLPCKFVRLDPTKLDHTITYIPDINGHAYYADITENDFLMSKDACGFAEIADLAFSGIDPENDNADDGSFEYRKNGYVQHSNIKDCWQEKMSYKDWFNEYTWNEETDKNFVNKYVEKGSGTYGTHYASYQEFDKQPYFTKYNSKDDNELLRGNDELTQYWFLNDFYKNPKETEKNIIDKKIDDEVLKVTGVKKNYDSNDPVDIANAVKETISVGYFPSYKDEKIVAETTALTKDTDYEVTCDKFDLSNKTAEVTITGKGDYSGTYTIPVTLYTASVAQPPVKKKNLVYDGAVHKLVKAGTAENGTMQYGIGTKDKEPSQFTDTIPTAVDAGAYYVYYRVKSVDDSHADSETKCLPGPVRIDPINVEMTVADYTIAVGKTVTIAPKFSENIPVKCTFESEDPSIATVNDKGVLKGKKVGYTGIYIDAATADGNTNYDVEGGVVEVKVVKAANPMTLKAKTVKMKAKDLKKKARTIKRVKAFTVKNAKGTLSYKLVTAKKGTKSFKKKFKINAKTGKITVKKGLKKGTYKVTVKVKAKGTAAYKASAWKKVTFKVKVK